MKKSILQLEFWTVLLFLMATIQLKAQMRFSPKSPDALSDFSYTIANDAQTSSKIFEFDLYLLDIDNSQDFELSAVQAGIVVNSSIKNGGTITATIIAGTSELVASQQPTSVTFTASQNCIKLAGKTPPGVGSGTILSKNAPGTRICRIRLTNTVDYPAGVKANLTFNFTTTPYATKVLQYIGTSTELVCNSSNCTSNATNIWLNAWQGGTSTDWATASNWNPPAVPTESWNAYIPNPVTHSVVVNEASGSPAVCNNLTISAGSSLTIAPGKALTVSGTVTNNAGNTGLVIESNATGTGSLKMNTTSIAGTGSRYFQAGNSWHFLASPMAGMAITGSNFDPTAADDFYTWHEPSPGTWVNFKNTTVSPTFAEVNGNLNFNPGLGYLVAYDGVAGSRLFTGNFNAGTQNVTLHNTAWGANSGWNLLGNPYTSGIDWNLADRSMFKDDYAYIYDPNKSGGEGYITVYGQAPNAYIGATQGFFVQALITANGQNFQFTSAMQVHGGTSYKSSETDESFKIRLSGNNHYDETTFQLKEVASLDRERDDALKMYSFNNSVPQIYSFSSDQIGLSVNTIPESGQDNQIPLGLRIPASSQYEISISEPAGSLFPNGVFLEDKLLGKHTNLLEGNYSFLADQGELTNRFVLQFMQVGINPQAENSKLKAWYTDGRLYVKNIKGKLVIKVWHLTGSLVYQNEVLIENDHNQVLDIEPGFYIIEINHSGVKSSLKAIINN